MWRQDHNGFSHQDPGFIDHVVNKKAEVVRVYLPPDTNTLLSTVDHCLRSRNYVNVIVAGKQPNPDWLDMDAAILHCTRGAGIWEWASNDYDGQEPDVIMACAGDVPTLEILAATSILRENLPDLRIRVVNVVDLMRLEPNTEHPHGMSDAEFNAVFTTNRPVIFAYHGYPALIHRLTYCTGRPPQLPCPRVHGGGHHDHPVRHGGAEQHGPVPPGHGRHRPGPRAGRQGRLAAPADGGQPDQAPRLCPGARRGPARGAELGLARRAVRPAGRCWRRPRPGSRCRPAPGPACPRRTRPDMDVLVVNAGSSSLKLSLLDAADEILAATEVQHWDTEDPPPPCILF